MCDEWMPPIRLTLTREQLRQLPRNAAYRYEWLDGEAHLRPRPRHYHALLDLRPIDGDDAVPLRPVAADDWEALVPVFATAFRDIQPFGSLDDATLLEAARACLRRTATGGDGPWIETASFVADGPDGEGPAGAALVTLLPAGDPCDWDSYYWPAPPPPDCIARRLGRPHLTWIFVAPPLAGRGTGTALLAAAVRRLLGLGYTVLASTFLLGNDSSMLWHWRNGFRLLAHPGSSREVQKRWRRAGG
jgi:GNAT superfamily N-acetyltransferase